MDPSTLPILAATAALAVSATVFAGGVARILRRLELLAEPADGVLVDVCGALEPVAGYRCDLTPHGDDVRHYDRAHQVKWGNAHTVPRGAAR